MSIKMKVKKVCPFFDDKDITDSSKRLYCSKLKKLNDGVPPTDFKFLKDKEAIKIKLETQPLNTRRSSVIAIVSAVRDKDAELHGYFTQLMDSLNKESAEVTKGTKSEKQKENWLSLNELNTILEGQERLIVGLKRKKKINEDQYESLLSHLVLSLYTKMPPRRSTDYTAMVVSEPTEDKDKNYFHNGHFYFNNYKTKKTYQQQVVKISKDMIDLLKLYLKFKPKDQTNLLVSASGTPLTEKTLRQMLHKATGKEISTQMLRNIYVTDKISPIVETMNDTAEKMGTSVSQLLNTYSK